MSFYYRKFIYEDPEDSVWLCLCRECGHEWEVPIEPDMDEETGRIVEPRPSYCKLCESENINVDRE